MLKILTIIEKNYCNISAFDKQSKRLKLMSRMELDSHANMAVVGKDAYITATLSETAQVSPFNPR